jgi:glutamate 5-kinase
MRILIKIGSAIVISNNKLNYELIRVKIKEISKLQKQNNEIILVTSGAVAAGMEIENLENRPKDSLRLQLLSGIGQINLMKTYQKLFSKENIKVSQILLTHHNFDNKEEKTTMTNIINSYLNQNIIPIVNENDLINKEEFESKYNFSDNDILTALIARCLKPDLVLILTDVDGLHKSPPYVNNDSGFISKVNKVDEEIKNMALNETNPLGLGGMYSKVIAADMIMGSGIDVIVGNGNFNIKELIDNKVKRTLFKSKS